MALSKYIRDLLFRYECVIVPEFGGFLTKTVSAKIDEETNTFYPPTKRLGFNSQLVDNDGLLANYITAVDQIPYEAALNYIDFEVKEWQKRLTSENVSLDGIGNFSLNNENKLQFEPDTTINYLTDAFGLSTLVAPEIARLAPLQEEVVFDLISGDISDKEIYLNTDYSGRKLGSLLKYAALIAILFAVGIFLTQWIVKINKDISNVAKLEADHDALLNKRIQEATFEINKTLPAITFRMNSRYDLDESELNEIELNQSEPDNNSVDSKEKISLADELVNIEEKTNVIATNNSELEENKETIVDAIQDNPISDTNDIETSKSKFHIIGGAYSEPSNAIKKVNQLKAKGYNASIIGVNKWQLTQVAFGSFATKEEAQTFLRKIKNTEAKDAWLLVN